MLSALRNDPSLGSSAPGGCALPARVEEGQSLAARQAGLVVLAGETLGRDAVERHAVARAVGVVEVLHIQHAVPGDES